MADYKVVDAEQLNADLTSVADKIREQTGKTEHIPFPSGFETAPAELVEVGKQAMNRSMMEAIQQGGARKNYASAFSSPYWTDDNFKPVYDMYTTATTEMFWNSYITNLKGILEKQGVVLDTSGSGNIYQIMRDSKITHSPTISCLGVTIITQSFYGCRDLISLKLVLKADGTNTFSTPFAYCESLVDLEVEGVIGANDFNLRWSTKLSRASIESVINALSTTTTGLSVTLSETAVNNAFTTDEWNALIATRPNWTINLL